MRDCEDEVARALAQRAMDAVKSHESTCTRMWALAIAVVTGLVAVVGYLASQRLTF